MTHICPPLTKKILSHLNNVMDHLITCCKISLIRKLLMQKHQHKLVDNLMIILPLDQLIYHVTNISLTFITTKRI